MAFDKVGTKELKIAKKYLLTKALPCNKREYGGDRVGFIEAKVAAIDAEITKRSYER